jgi:hypothetical protein
MDLKKRMKQAIPAKVNRVVSIYLGFTDSINNGDYNKYGIETG